MLVLSRKKGQAVVIADNIVVSILEIEGDVVKLGIAAPKEVLIHREELLISIKQSNLEAAEGGLNLPSLADQIKKIRKKTN
ncbi:carbon storage regulator CsrA [Paenibacillaceae bacterium WGS1546]|uniref:carbon storage regulator CsrA n=1 Tax=Cohnella sp. WGS1546 TaxID=3366810 RepID=UPI00372D3360